MKSRLLWTNYKIYAVIIGMLVGTLVYNIIGVDFSFALIDNIHSENFGESYIFFLLQNIKYFIIIMLLSLLKQNKKVLFVILCIQAYIASGAITLCIVLKKTFLITGAVGGLVKGIVADIYLDGQAGIKRILFLLMSIFIGTLIENFFAFYL